MEAAPDHARGIAGRWQSVFAPAERERPLRPPSAARHQRAPSPEGPPPAGPPPTGTSPTRTSPSGTPATGTPASSAAAILTASTIFTYPVQRQTLPDRARRI